MRSPADSVPSCSPGDFSWCVPWAAVEDSLPAEGRPFPERWIAGFFRVIAQQLEERLELPPFTLEVWGGHAAQGALLRLEPLRACLSVFGVRKLTYYPKQQAILVTAAVLGPDGEVVAWSGDRVGSKPMYAVVRREAVSVDPTTIFARARKLKRAIGSG